jgi:hypothetical protein
VRERRAIKLFGQTILIAEKADAESADSESAGISGLRGGPADRMLSLAPRRDYSTPAFSR